MMTIRTSGHCVSAVALSVALVWAGTTHAQQAPSEPSSIRMSQVGFETFGPKIATVADSSRSPLSWSVVDSEGKTAASGRSTVFGNNVGSGEFVHVVRFQDVNTQGEGYRLTVGNHISRPFRIVEHPHAGLPQDALSYFYQNRSGIAIEAGLVERPDLARGAGHKPEVVGCFSGADLNGVIWPGCDYTLETTGGWYDAGDEGKYVVNGGLSVWILMNAYERAMAADDKAEAATGDGTMRVPESGNGVSDLLDEARWEMEFLLSMQIPDGAKASVVVGKPLAGATPEIVEIDAGGLAHHKVHHAQWRPLPASPAQDDQPRFLYPPSTAATLNLSATGAQCARIWTEIDPEFSRRCLIASQRAFRAALRNREIYAVGHFDGGGDYNDTDMADEFYWAAAELYVTIKNPAFLTAMRTSPMFLGAPRSDASSTGDIGWKSVGTLGSITLALVDNDLPQDERQRVRDALTATAKSYLADGDAQGYGLPYAGPAYNWGSNGDVLNRAIVLGLAFDFTADWNYRNGVIQALDYVMGRNPLDRSFVTGYGARPMRNPHHRFWAHNADTAYPEPPAGAVSGGPNSSLMTDDVARTMQGKCAPQLCWADDINAYSMNEVAINWNAALFWSAVFIDAR